MVKKGIVRKRKWIFLLTLDTRSSFQWGEMALACQCLVTASFYLFFSGKPFIPVVFCDFESFLLDHSRRLYSQQSAGVWKFGKFNVKICGLVNAMNFSWSLDEFFCIGTIISTIKYICIQFLLVIYVVYEKKSMLRWAEDLNINEMQWCVWEDDQQLNGLHCTSDCVSTDGNTKP